MWWRIAAYALAWVGGSVLLGLFIGALIRAGRGPRRDDD